MNTFIQQLTANGLATRDIVNAFDWNLLPENLKDEVADLATTGIDEYYTDMWAPMMMSA